MHMYNCQYMTVSVLQVAMCVKSYILNFPKDSYAIKMIENVIGNSNIALEIYNY